MSKDKGVTASRSGCSPTASDLRSSQRSIPDAVGRLERSTWDSRVLPNRVDVLALVDAHRHMSGSLLAVIEAVRDYLPPDGIDEQECLNRIIGATDNPTINPIIAEIENGHS